MTSLERVRAAFEHREPDRTPFFEKLIKWPISDLVLGRPNAGQNWEYRMQRLAEGDWRGLMLQEARDLVDTAEVLGMDLVRLYPNGLEGPKPERLGEGVWRVGDHVHTRLPSGWIRTEAVNPSPPASEAEEEEWWVRWGEEQPEEAPYQEDEWLVFREAKRVIEEERLDIAIFVSAYTIPVATLPRPLWRWFRQRPEALKRCYRRWTESGLRLAREAIARGAHVVGFGGDLACDHGPMISPSDYSEFIAPCIRAQADAAHALGVPCSNASDGNLWPVLDSFLLETDVDGFEEIDYSAGMDLRRLKARYGDRICFIGNMDIRHILTHGTVEDCRRATVECIEAGWGSGGHVLMSSNCIHEDVRPENFFAYVEAYRKHFGLS